MWAGGGHQGVVTRSGRRLGAWWASLLVAVLLGVCVAVPASADEDEEGFVNFALPAGGEVVVENRRGDVRIEVWDGEQVGLAATIGPGGEAPKPSPRRAGRGKKGAPGSRLPFQVENGSSLKITV